MLASCSTSVGKWTYPSGRYAASISPQPGDASVAVLPFLDERCTHNVTSMVWSYIPLFPFGWSHFDRPETTVHGPDTTNWTADPGEDFARSFVIELLRERLVREAVYASDFHFPAAATHVLRGRLRSCYVSETRWTYGLSIYAPLLWGLGLPIGTSTNGFEVDLELTEARSGRVIWKESIYDSDYHIEGYYYGPEWYRFPWMWERRLRQKLDGLAAALGARPAPLPPGLAEELRQAPPLVKTPPSPDQE